MYNVMLGFGLREVLYFGIVFGLFIYALSDLITREFQDKSMKIIWVLVIIFIPVLGPIFYLLVGRKSGKIQGA